ncbi:hypothetical protein IQR32_05555 [Acinetobacter albensis]|nr:MULTISPECIES: hypothetical protein [Acinetobacter]MBE9400819.1 hypothetical protein [Acinetobacter albensis]
MSKIICHLETQHHAVQFSLIGALLLGCLSSVVYAESGQTGLSLEQAIQNTTNYQQSQTI